MKKEFLSIDDGLNYMIRCPNCNSLMEINDRDAEVKTITNSNATITSKLEFDLYSADLLIVDFESGSCEIKSDSYNLYSGGVLHQRLGIECNDCCQYYYVLNLKIDLETMLVSGLYLDSETLTVEKDHIVYEIKNSYSIGQTHYSVIKRIREAKGKVTHIIDSIDKTIDLPLVPLDVFNPDETLKRINNLIIFS